MELPLNYEAKFKKTKVEFEFQSLCEENQKMFGKLIWTLPWIKGVTDVLLREAIEIAKKRGITTIPYLKGIIKRLQTK